MCIRDSIERLKSRLDAAALPAWRMLHAAYLEALAEPGRPAATAGERDWSASVVHSGAVDEVMAATGLGESECRRRLNLAVADPARVDTLPVSYTHLDVYKRQVQILSGLSLGDTVVIGDASQPLPTNGGFGGFGGGIGGLTGGGGVRVPGAGIGGGAPPGGAPPGR